jgi:hemerythrin-like metal-binding protein
MHAGARPCARGAGGSSFCSPIIILEAQGVFMPQIFWTDQLSIGNAAIDTEHQKLLQIANALIEAMKNDLPKPEFVKILHELREYTVFHFTNEEEYMRSIKYPDLNEQIDAHNQLKRRVKDLQSAVFRGEKISHDELRAILTEWLVGHILNVDLKIRDFVLASQASLPASRTETEGEKNT